MANEKEAYSHEGEVTGFGAAPDETAETEHRDSARGDATERNELRPEERNRQDGYGPRTHPSTQFTTRDGADEE